MPGHRLTHTRSVPQGGSQGKAVPSPRQRGPALSVTPWSGGLQVWVDASLQCACQDVCGPCTNVTVAKVCGQIRHGQLQRLRVEEVWGWWKTLSPSPWKASPHPFFPGSTSLLRSQLFSLLPPEQHRGMGNGGLWSGHNSSSLLLLHSNTFPMGSLLRATVLRDKPGKGKLQGATSARGFCSLLGPAS